MKGDNVKFRGSLLAFDVDGTLLNSQGQLTERTVTAISSARALFKTYAVRNATNPVDPEGEANMHKKLEKAGVIEVDWIQNEQEFVLHEFKP